MEIAAAEAATHADRVAHDVQIRIPFLAAANRKAAFSSLLLSVGRQRLPRHEYRSLFPPATNSMMMTTSTFIIHTQQKFFSLLYFSTRLIATQFCKARILSISPSLHLQLTTKCKGKVCLCSADVVQRTYCLLSSFSSFSSLALPTKTLNACV